jgi:hypothetical protein
VGLAFITRWWLKFVDGCDRKVGSMQMGVAVVHFQAFHNHFPKDAKGKYKKLHRKSGERRCSSNKATWWKARFTFPAKYKDILLCKKSQMAPGPKVPEML